MLSDEEAEEYRKEAVKAGISQDEAQRGLDILNLAKSIANNKIEENKVLGIAKLKEDWESEAKKEYGDKHKQVKEDAHTALKYFVKEKDWDENVKDTVYEANPFLIKLGQGIVKKMKDDNIKFGEIFNTKKSENDTIESLFD